MPRNKISVRKIKAELRKGPFIKDVHTLGGGWGRGSSKSGPIRAGEGELVGGWLAKCGRPLGKKTDSYHI